MATKVIVIEKAFYHGEILKPGRTISIKEDKIPSWAKKMGNKQVKETNEPSQENAGESEGQNRGILSIFNFNKNTVIEKSDAELNTELSGKTEDELNEILNKLIDKGVENNIYLDNTNNKTLIEQIIELEKALKQKQG